MESNIKELQKENEKIRKYIENIIFINELQQDNLWLHINRLINNEIEQEKECNI
tara:strand:+ start:94 stop:255 length:162 start_codon:yes stop_codon:yes gene_type:complete